MSTPIVGKYRVSVQLRGVWAIVFEDTEDDVEHLVGDAGESDEVVLAAVDLSLIDLGEEAQPRQIAQGLDLSIRDSADFQISLPQQMGDQQGIGAVGLGATDGDVTPRRHDQGIDDLNGIPGFDQGSFLRDDDRDRIAGGNLMALLQEAAA